jgi:hypothetical protein
LRPGEESHVLRDREVSTEVRGRERGGRGGTLDVDHSGVAQEDMEEGATEQREELEDGYSSSLPPILQTIGAGDHRTVSVEMR